MTDAALAGVRRGAADNRLQKRKSAPEGR